MVRKRGWIERNGRTDDEPPDDDGTDDGDSGCLAGKRLAEGGDDHDHELNAI